MQSGEGGTRVVGRERRHVAHTPSRRRLRLRGAYQPPSIISMRISIFYPVFPKFMQTSGPSSTLHSHPPSALRPNHQPPSCSVFYTFPSSSLVLSLPILPTYEPFPFVPVSLPLCPSRFSPLFDSSRYLAVLLALATILSQPLLWLAVSVSSVLFGMCVGPIHLTSSSGLSHHDAPRTSSSRGGVFQFTLGGWGSIHKRAPTSTPATRECEPVFRCLLMLDYVFRLSGY